MGIFFFHFLSILDIGNKWALSFHDALTSYLTLFFQSKNNIDNQNLFQQQNTIYQVICMLFFREIYPKIVY